MKGVIKVSRKKKPNASSQEGGGPFTPSMPFSLTRTVLRRSRANATRLNAMISRGMKRSALTVWIAAEAPQRRYSEIE